MTAIVVSLLVLQQSPTEVRPAESAGAAEKAAAAAEKAALAAEKAAVAAEKAAQAAVELAQASAPPAAAPAEAPKPGTWSGVLGFGLISLTGNAESLTFNGTAAFERKYEKWAFGAKASGAYGQTRPADGGEPAVVALNASVQGRADRKVTAVASAYLLAGVDTDHVKSLEARGYGEGGTGIVWVERKEADFTRLSFKTDLALRYAHESRFQYFPAPQQLDDLSLLAPRVGMAFTYALSKQVSFREDAELLFNVAGTARLIANSTTKLSARLTESLSLGVSFLVTHDSTPAPGKKPTDTSLTVGLEVAL